MESMELNKPKQELKKVPEHGHDILNLSAAEAEQLKSRIEKWKGLVRMFVHPMYEKWRYPEEEYPKHPDIKELLEIEKVLAKLLAMPVEKTPPILIMEETKYVNELQDWLRKNPQGNSQNEVYFIKTFPNHPMPQLESKSEKDAWNALSDTLSKLGVKKILMGGMQFDVSEFKRDWTNKGPWVGYCVGIVLSHLSKDKAGKFEVELSALTQPRSKRKYFNSVKHKDGLIGGGDW